MSQGIALYAQVRSRLGLFAKGFLDNFGEYVCPIFWERNGTYYLLFAAVLAVIRKPSVKWSCAEKIFRKKCHTVVIKPRFFKVRGPNHYNCLWTIAEMNMKKINCKTCAYLFLSRFKYKKSNLLCFAKTFYNLPLNLFTWHSV